MSIFIPSSSGAVSRRIAVRIALEVRRDSIHDGLARITVCQRLFLDAH
jgi:hypothetical protein